MIIKNPTNSDITVQIKGVQYTVLAESSLKNVPEQVALYWKLNLHPFLELQEEVFSSPETVEEIKEAVEETTVEAKEEEKVEGEETAEGLDLKDLSKADLVDLATQIGIDTVGKNKAELIKEIENK